MQQRSPDQPLDMLIVGAGITGIGMAAHLREKCPDKRFAIVERRARIGGTWDLFRYPGVRSDSDMSTLAYAIEPWTDSATIAGGEAIRAYLERTAASRGVAETIRFGQRLVAADWDHGAACWTATLADDEGRCTTLSARFLFLGSGYYDYDKAHDPAIPGLGSFAGDVVQPQFWPADFAWTGKRVVVIGSGATAVTLVPALAEAAAEVVLLQRTPSWYFSHPARDPVDRWLRKLLPAKAAHALTRLKNIRLNLYLVSKSLKAPAEMKAFLHKQLAKQLGAYDAKDFTPPYDPWQQRMCIVPDGDLFKAIKAGKARVVTGRIAAVDAGGIALEDGSRIDADAIVTATGLHFAPFGGIALSVGGEPVRLPDRFYYRNCMLSNVPNLAAPFGYLTAAWTLRIELVADWLCRLLNHMDARGMQVATPRLPEDHGLTLADPFAAFSSGYLQRGRHLIPKSATIAPWQIGMDYVQDRRAMRRDPIDDGVLCFERAPAPLPA